MAYPVPAHIRPATPADMEAVWLLVKELAVFEKAPEEVVTTPDTYRQWYAEGVFDCLVAELDGNIVGIALYYSAFSTWKGKMLYLDDLIVTKKHRGKGIGTQLLTHFIHTARLKGANIVKWQVLDWNKEAITFYEKMGAIIEKDWWNVKFFVQKRAKP